MQNKTRSLLTSLGIIFGVASVIAMLAIGKGAEQEILNKMKILGTNNIIVEPKIETKDNETDNSEDGNEGSAIQKKSNGNKKFSKGLTLADGKSIKKILSGINFVIPEVLLDLSASREGLRKEVKLVGTNDHYFTNNNVSLKAGSWFIDKHYESAMPVCIIGSGIYNKLFPSKNVIGKNIKVGNKWLKVVGVIKDRNISKKNIKALGIRNYNFDIYIPVNTMLLRYKNRALVTKKDLKRKRDDNDKVSKAVNYHQIDILTVNIKNNEKINQTSQLISRMLKRRHNNNIDFEIVVPELLLQQEQQTKQVFNFVLGAIASISLLVGGIGIMNIMLASVLERTKEIGIRKAVGATRHDILFQFLNEAVSISISGGIAGIILGVSASYIIEWIAGIQTFVSVFAVFISFFVSITVGLVFGIAPARKASKEDPINLLRYE